MSKPHANCRGFREGESFEKSRDCWECWQAQFAPARTASGCCGDCPEAGGPAPLRRVRIPSELLARGGDDRRFNPSVIRHQGRLVLAYRTGLAGSNIFTCELSGPDYTPGPSALLNLAHREAGYGREDPRFFHHQGRLHLAFIGVKGKVGPTSQLYARLSDDLRVEEIYYPHFAHRPGWEKNWGFFEWEEKLYAAYSIRPQHVIYRIDGGAAFPVCGSPNPLPWSGGHLRGGAAPVRVDKEFLCWAHGQVWKDGVNTYSIGAYAFRAEPPFEVTRQTPTPVMWPVECKNHPPGYSVIFPAGAVLEGNRWVVSYGVQDQWVEIAEFDAAAVDRAMVSKVE